MCTLVYLYVIIVVDEDYLRLSHDPLTPSTYYKNKDIDLYNHSTIIKFRKLNIDTILLSNLQYMFRFHQLSQ